MGACLGQYSNLLQNNMRIHVHMYIYRSLEAVIRISLKEPCLHVSLTSSYVPKTAMLSIDVYATILYQKLDSENTQATSF